MAATTYCISGKLSPFLDMKREIEGVTTTDSVNREVFGLEAAIIILVIGHAKEVGTQNLFSSCVPPHIFSLAPHLIGDSFSLSIKLLKE